MWYIYSKGITSASSSVNNSKATAVRISITIIIITSVTIVGTSLSPLILQQQQSYARTTNDVIFPIDNCCVVLLVGILSIMATVAVNICSIQKHILSIFGNCVISQVSMFLSTFN